MDYDVEELAEASPNTRWSADAASPSSITSGANDGSGLSLLPVNPSDWEK